MHVCVFAPHPDDDVIGCGGSVLKHVAAGATASIHYLTSGDGGDRRRSREDMARVREDEAVRAARKLGVDNLQFLRRPDGLLGETLDLLVELVNVVRERRPAIAYVPHAGDDHPDHVAAHRVVTRALRTAGGPWLPESSGESWTTGVVLGYEVWTPIQRPVYFEETTDVFDAQLAALAEHRSQLADIPYDQMLRGLASYRGARFGPGRTCEAFDVLRLPASSLGGGAGGRDART
jgi:LmbE family N-acetylglucosaminyl deacetylase